MFTISVQKGNATLNNFYKV